MLYLSIFLAGHSLLFFIKLRSGRRRFHLHLHLHILKDKVPVKCEVLLTQSDESGLKVRFLFLLLFYFFYQGFLSSEF